MSDAGFSDFGGAALWGRTGDAKIRFELLRNKRLGDEQCLSVMAGTILAAHACCRKVNPRSVETEKALLPLQKLR
jgi:hypothetical protein